MPWHTVDPSTCETTSRIPSALFIDEHLSSDAQLVRVSNHPFCQSCYSLYIQVCKEVADRFELVLNEKEEWTIIDLNNAIRLFLKGYEKAVYSKETIHTDIQHIEEKLIAICRCIRARIYHHTVCTKPNQINKVDGKKVNVGNLYSDVNHDVFILQNCYQFYRLYNLYKSYINYYNVFFTRRYEDILIKEYEDVLLKCERKFHNLDVSEEQILDKEWLKENREKYVTDKTSDHTKASRTHSKSKYKPVKQIRVMQYPLQGIRFKSKQEIREEYTTSQTKNKSKKKKRHSHRRKSAATRARQTAAARARKSRQRHSNSRH